MSTPTSAYRRRRLNPSYEAWELIWSYVHDVLVLNAGTVLTASPLLAGLALTRQSGPHPTLLVLLSLCLGPALAGAFGYLQRGAEDGQVRSVEFLRAYRRTFRAAALSWTAYALPAWAAAYDAVLLRRTTLGLAVSPALAVLALLAASSGVLAMARLAAGLTVRQDPRVRRYLTPTYLLLRHWPLTLLNLVVITAGLVLMARQPLLGLATVPGCALTVLWRNSLASAA